MSARVIALSTARAARRAASVLGEWAAFWRVPRESVSLTSSLAARGWTASVVGPGGRSSGVNGHPTRALAEEAVRPRFFLARLLLDLPTAHALEALERGVLGVAVQLADESLRQRLYTAAALIAEVAEAHHHSPEGSTR